MKNIKCRTKHYLRAKVDKCQFWSVVKYKNKEIVLNVYEQIKKIFSNWKGEGYNISGPLKTSQ